MKINSYAISMQSLREFKASYTRSESLNTWKDSKSTQNQKLTDESNLAAGIRKWMHDQLNISEQAQEALKNEVQQELYSPAVIASFDDLPNLSDENKRKILILESMLSVLLGRKIKFLIPKQNRTGDFGGTTAELNAKDANFAMPSSQGRLLQSRQKWGFIYERHESYQESEKLSFFATGIIRTNQGHEIHFEVDLTMKREFAAVNNISVRTGDALLDPLVINYDTPVAQLSPRKYSFDLDADGLEDQISFIGEGSGFLAIDWNGDSIINNGKELFGPATGNGFAELTEYDQDQNSWIDENDPIFEKLRIWTKNAAGNDNLFGLGQKGIGAIFLGNIDAQFALKDTQNQILGQAQSAGIFIRENGSAGIIQQVDLTTK